MSRGDLIEIWIGKNVFRGHVRHARNDLLVLQGPAYLDVNLAAPLVMRVVERSAIGGVAVWPNGAQSFAARLAELEQSEEICEFLAVPSEAQVAGKVSIRARDHVIVEDAGGREWILPLAGLAAAVHLSPPPPAER
jgi:hypothetical protein